MRRFRYWADPLFPLLRAYVLNRWLLKPHSIPLLAWIFNDLLLIRALCRLSLAAEMPWLRQHDRAPQWLEVFFHLVVWSLLFEVIGPHLIRHATGDRWM